MSAHGPVDSKTPLYRGDPGLALLLHLTLRPQSEALSENEENTWWRETKSTQPVSLALEYSKAVWYTQSVPL